MPNVRTNRTSYKIQRQSVTLPISVQSAITTSIGWIQLANLIGALTLGKSTAIPRVRGLLLSTVARLLRGRAMATTGGREVCVFIPALAPLFVVQFSTGRVWLRTKPNSPFVFRSYGAACI